MARTIELPEDVYENLEKAARERGMTASDWIASVVPGDQDSSNQRSLHEVLQSLVGAIDSSEEPTTGYAPTAISELVLEKLQKQGLRRP
jgi:predicted CopG family antitoxin